MRPARRRAAPRAFAAALALALAAAAFAAPGPGARAVEPGEALSDPALEARARELSRNIRCLVCQNQSIDDSDADLARDLRALLRERLVAGDADEDIYGFLSARYGDFVLLKPPVRPSTWALWFGPAAALALGAAAVAVVLARSRRAPPPLPLDEGEKRRLARLAAEDGADGREEER